MTVSQATIKGQVVIPVTLRRKYHIQKGTRLAIMDRGTEIVIKPIGKNPVREGLGMVRKGRSALKVLLEDRKIEAKR